ncbi:MAG: GPR endopeptidase [Ruminococcaceae bacterium]|nr:GPR endopeptidase [Oscillospiraceae bacterium]
MEKFVRTDLACEYAADENAKRLNDLCHEERIEGFRVYRMRIETPADSALLNKPIGHYITVECNGIMMRGDCERQRLSRLLSDELVDMSSQLTRRDPDGEFSVFVAGLGNAELTADAVGPQAISKLVATRHLREHEGELYRAIGCSALSALAPGVLGQTGIETLELLRGVVATVKPDLVLVIDALAARSCDRLAATVQICDAGVCPGSGVGNHRSEISARSLGVPVVVLGVPTVVDSSTLVYDALRSAGIEKISPTLERVLENGKSFFVSPKESDSITSFFATVIAEAIHFAFVGEEMI